MGTLVCNTLEPVSIAGSQKVHNCGFPANKWQRVRVTLPLRTSRGVSWSKNANLHFSGFRPHRHWRRCSRLTWKSQWRPSKFPEAGSRMLWRRVTSIQRAKSNSESWLSGKSFSVRTSSKGGTPWKNPQICTKTRTSTQFIWSLSFLWNTVQWVPSWTWTWRKW